MNLSVPNKQETEEALIGLVLQNPEMFSQIGEKLRPSEFYSIGAQQLWSAFHEMYKQNIDIDIVSTRSMLKKQEIDPKAGMNLAGEALQRPVSTHNVDVFIKEIKNTAILRRLIILNQTSTEKLYDAETSAENVIADIQKDLLKITDDTADKYSPELGSILNEVRVDLSQVGVGEYNSFKTGFPSLDARTGGLIPSQVWILGAYTGTGKTFMSLQIVLNALEQGAKVAFFSTEMDRKLCVIRLLAKICNIAPITLLTRQLTPDEEEKLTQAQLELSKYKNQLFVFDSVFTPEEIRMKSKRLKVQQGLDLVVVDFIQNLKGSPNIYERMSNSAIELQQLAMEEKLTLVLASQVNQDSADWKKGEAISYKGAGEIAAIADVGLWMVKDEEEKYRRWLYLRKVRHGDEGKLALDFKFPAGLVTEAIHADPTSAPDKVKRFNSNAMVNSVNLDEYKEDQLSDADLGF